MIAIPALDLREGACVQLVGGRYEDERVRLDHPLTVARDWVGQGFRRLHVVDLDAATGRGSNAAVVEALVALPAVAVQAGGGVRDERAIAALLDAGAAAVVVGSRAVGDRAWLERAAAAFPGRLIVAADVRGREVVAGGWTRGTGREVCDFVATLDPLPLAAVLVTAVHREGRREGTDLELMRDVAACSRHPLQAAGGVASLGDLRDLAAAGVAGAVLGMALYAGGLDPAALVEEFVT